MNQSMHKEVARGISRRLASDYNVRTETPDRLRKLLVRLSLTDREPRADTKKHCVLPETGGADSPSRRELDKYLAKIVDYLPGWLCEPVRWIRKPERFAARAVVAFLLILGSVFSFLPVLGLWMLPVGLIIISQDLVFLQRPLLRTFKWVERKWRGWRG